MGVRSFLHSFGQRRTGAAPPDLSRHSHAVTGLLLVGAALTAAGLTASPPRVLVITGMSMLGLAIAQAGWRRFAQRRPSAPEAGAAAATVCPAVRGLHQLDQRMLSQLDRAVSLSETSSLRMIERVSALRMLSSRLMVYLRTAGEQSTRMQAEIDLNGSIVAELAGFVEQLPQQIAQERQYLGQLVGEVEQLATITETIRLMSRQTEILSINAAIAAAHAGEAGRSFAVLAVEVRRLATQSSESAIDIEKRIHRLVSTVQARSGGEFAARMRHNEAESARLLALTNKLDEGYLDMRQFYAMLLTAVTEHNSALDRDITELLDTAQFQDVFKQIVDRLNPAFQERHEVLTELIARLRSGRVGTVEVDARAQALADNYLHAEAAHRDPDDVQGGRTERIELF
jgi:methyl-accepting chemotaxis protein